MKNFIDYDIWASTTEGKPGVMVFLDPGHGGLIMGKYTTAGKQFDHGTFQFFEGVWNREIVKQLSVKFKNNNITHAFTTISNHDESLSERIFKISNIIKSYPKCNFILLSIHANAGGVESANGMELFTTPSLTDSDYAANYMFPYFYNLGLKVRINRAQNNEFDKESNFYIIRKAEELGCIAMLYEGGFFTNKEEATKMLESEFQGNMVNALFMGIKDIIIKIKTDGTVR